MLKKKILGLLLLIGGWFGAGLGMEQDEWYSGTSHIRKLEGDRQQRLTVINDQQTYRGSTQQSHIFQFEDVRYEIKKDVWQKRVESGSFPAGATDEVAIQNEFDSSVQKQVYEGLPKQCNGFFQTLASYLTWFGIGYFFTPVLQSDVNKEDLKANDNAPFFTDWKLKSKEKETLKSPNFNPHYGVTSWFQAHPWLLAGGVGIFGIWATSHFKNHQQTGKWLPGPPNPTFQDQMSSFIQPFFK
ncbi:hypothetical protein IPH25_00665 [bacterium]|nr:MAG: hypothetical protein IPG37_02785 [bacterium]QQR61943.1 MAG: hypothetical protein IPH25_00665 [bacterium]QQR62466.1 MAG: hypothetical protein IPH67_03515 [bacterium]